jgi:transposase
LKRLHRALLAIVRDDPVCRQLMSVPGVGAIVAITFKSGVDDPTRFRHSRDVGPHFGLTSRKYQSGELDVTGAISKRGDPMIRTALYEAASVMLTGTVRFSVLKAWAMAVARRRGTTACGSTAPASAGPTRRPRSHKNESFEQRQAIGLATEVSSLGR